MDFAGAMISVRKQSAIDEQLKRLAGGVSARYFRLRVFSEYGGGIGFYLQPHGFYKRELVFSVAEDECFDKSDEEIAALVEKHIPGYLDRLDRARAEQKRRQQIRVKRNNEQISYKREQSRKHAKCEVCRTPIVEAVRFKRYCSARCRQVAHRQK
jgi:hypothetical protein